MQPSRWGPRSRDGVCSAQWERAGLNWPRTLTTQGCLCGLVLRNSHFFLQQWSVRIGRSSQGRTSTEMLCDSLGRNSRYYHYSEHGMNSEMETQGLTVRLTHETRHLRNSGHVVILSWLAALDCQAWEKGKMSHKTLALPILSTSLPKGHPRLWVCGKDDKYIQVGLAVSVI